MALGRYGTAPDYLVVGHDGEGWMDITGGGAVYCETGGIGGTGIYGEDGVGVVTVAGEGSKWINTYNLYVGFGSYGTLNITEGGLVTVGHELFNYYSDRDKIKMSLGGDAGAEGRCRRFVGRLLQPDDGWAERCDLVLGRFNGGMDRLDGCDVRG